MERDLFYFQYFTCWYYSNIAFALVDVLPRSKAQIVFMLVVYVLNTIGYSTIIGIFIDTAQALQEKAADKQDTIDNANDQMNSI